MDIPAPNLQPEDDLSGLAWGKSRVIALPVPPWDTYTVAASLAAGYFLIPLLATQLLVLINPFLGDTEQLFIQQGVTLLTWVSIFAFLHWRYGSFRESLGLSLSRPIRYYAWETVKLILLTTALTLSMNLLWMWLGKIWPGLHLEDKLPYSDFSSMELVVLVLFAVLMAPVLEELIFRGLIQSTFRKFCSPTWAVILTALVFLLLHISYFGDIKALMQVLVLGLFFSIWRERTQSLFPGMMAHLFNNGLASMLLLTHVK